MKRRRGGFTLIEVLVTILIVLTVGLGIGGYMLWQRVQKLNTWAVSTDAWLMNKLYPWIHDNSFQKGPGGGDPDPTKPPPPPDGL